MAEKCNEHAKDCEKFKENVMDYIDKELDNQTLLELEKHLGICIDCESFIEVYRKMLYASGSLKNKKFVTPEIRTRLKNVLKEKFCSETNKT